MYTIKTLKTIMDLIPIEFAYIDNHHLITLVIDHRYLYIICFFLFKFILTRFEYLNNVTGCDHTTCFLLNYTLTTFVFSDSLSINIFFGYDIFIDSLIYLYESSDWFEREVFDMFGIFFKFNKNLRRILTDYGFFFYPLRKDFPLSGYYEIFYNYKKKLLNYKKSFNFKVKTIKYFNFNWTFFKY